MSSCEIIANYRQLPRISPEADCLLFIKLGYLALVCIHLRVCYRHIATSEKKTSAAWCRDYYLFGMYLFGKYTQVV